MNMDANYDFEAEDLKKLKEQACKIEENQEINTEPAPMLSKLALLLEATFPEFENHEIKGISFKEEGNTLKLLGIIDQQKMLQGAEQLMKKNKMEGLKNLKNEITELKAKVQMYDDKLADYVNNLETPEKPKRWVPRQGDRFYYISETYVSEPLTLWPQYESLVQTGNCYKTKEEADIAAKKKYELDKLKYDIKCWIEDNDPVELDWSHDSGQVKYCIQFCYVKPEGWCTRHTINYRSETTVSFQMPGAFYCSSQELAEELIETFKDRLHLLLEE